MGIIRKLEAAQIHYTLAHNRYDGVTVQAAVPGQLWEIDVLEDGTVDFERFVSDGTITNEAELDGFIRQFAEPPTAAE